MSWLVEFDGRGSQVWPMGGDWTWGLELSSVGRAGAMREIQGEASVEIAGPRLTYRWDAGLSEWYENRAEGLEHGFTLHARPQGRAPQVELRVRVRGGLRGEASRDGRDVRFVGPDGRGRLDYADLKVFDANGTSLSASWSPCEDEMTLLIDDVGADYPLTIDPIAQVAYLKSMAPDSSDLFGYSLAVSGNRCVLGAPYEDGGSSGVAGSPFDNSVEDSGAAFVYVRDQGRWTAEAYLKPMRAKWNQGFGRSVDLDGDTIVIGAPHETIGLSPSGAPTEETISHAGAAYVYELGPTGWELRARLEADRPEYLGYFGDAVAVHGDRLVIGAPGESVPTQAPLGHTTTGHAKWSGAVYLFERRHGVWQPEVRIPVPNAGFGGAFGSSLALDHRRLLVGSPLDSSSASGVDGEMFDDGAKGSGAVFVYERAHDSWTLADYIKSDAPGSSDHFGSSLALHGETLVVGAPGEDSKAQGIDGNPLDDSWLGANSGAAYVLEHGDSGWTQQSFLKAAISKADYNFGQAVAVVGDTVLVGAPGEGGTATGIHGTAGSSVHPGSGAVYQFERTGSTWKQIAYIKASNSDSNDHFGFSLGLDNGLLMVGAWGESGAGPDTIGDPDDDSTPFAGAAYAFDLDADYTPYCAQSKPTSVPGCFATLSCSDPTLATGSWQATNIPRSDFAGPGTSVGVFLYTHGIGIGASLSKSTPSYGLLCLAGFQSSAPAYRPALLEGALPGVCNSGLMSTALAPAAAALGLSVGEDVNVQLWYRDPAPPANSRLSNAIHYTLK